MPTTAKYRRTYFALLRELGVADADRHALQEAHTGKASTRDWSAGEWRRVIAFLQRQAGQHRDAVPHVREDRPPVGGGAFSGHGATEAQCDLIEEIADEIAWRVGRELGPLAYLCRSSLKGPEADLRRGLMREAWDEGARGRGLWRRLTRREAADFVRALKHLKSREPAHA